MCFQNWKIRTCTETIQISSRMWTPLWFWSLVEDEDAWNEGWRLKWQDEKFFLTIHPFSSFSLILDRDYTSLAAATRLSRTGLPLSVGWKYGRKWMIFYPEIWSSNGMENQLECLCFLSWLGLYMATQFNLEDRNEVVETKLYWNWDIF